MHQHEAIHLERTDAFIFAIRALERAERLDERILDAHSDGRVPHAAYNALLHDAFVEAGMLIETHALGPHVEAYRVLCVKIRALALTGCACGCTDAQRGSLAEVVRAAARRGVDLACFLSGCWRTADLLAALEDICTKEAGR